MAGERRAASGLTVLAVSVREAARMLGIRRDTARRLIAAGELPAVRIGTRWRVPVAALEEWLLRLAEERAEVRV